MYVFECPWVPYEWVCLWVSALVCIFADYFCDQVWGGGILTYDAVKGTLRLTGQTVLWLLGPWGPLGKATSPSRWCDFHSYWTSVNIWDTFGTNSLIKITVWERQKERQGRRGFLCVWTDERGTEIFRGKKKLMWPLLSQCQLSDRFQRLWTKYMITYLQYLAQPHLFTWMCLYSRNYVSVIKHSWRHTVIHV